MSLNLLLYAYWRLSCESISFLICAVSQAKVTALYLLNSTERSTLGRDKGQYFMEIINSFSRAFADITDSNWQPSDYRQTNTVKQHAYVAFSFLDFCFAFIWFAVLSLIIITSIHPHTLLMGQAYGREHNLRLKLCLSLGCKSWLPGQNQGKSG